MSNEKRRFTRIPFQVNAEITVNGVSYNIDKISNLSIGGCLLPINADLEPGTACHIKIVLSGTSSKLGINVGGTIQRCASKTIAVKFTSIDPDSLFHLKNILRYNYPDSENVIDQEISEHPGII